MRRKYFMILPFCECKTYFHRGNCVPSAECALKCRETHQSSEQLFITFVSVCSAHWDLAERPWVFQEEWDEHIAEICELEVTTALKETSVAGLQCEGMRVNIEPGPPVEPEPTIKMRILGTLKLILWVTHAGRCCYPGLFQNFCNSEKEAVQKLLCWYK